MTSASVLPSTCTVDEPPAMGRNVVGIRTVTAMGETLPLQSEFVATVRRSLSAMRVLAAVDKYKGTATAAQVAAAIGHACWELGHDCVEQPVADGGEGTLEALGGANRVSMVTGPLGDPEIGRAHV